MAEADDDTRGLSKIIPKRKDTRRKNGSSNSEHILLKNEFSKKSNRNIYVNNKTPFKGQLCKCEKLIEKGASELIIHGFGAAVYKAVNLALQLKELHHGTLDFDIKTSTSLTVKTNLKTLSDDTDIERNSKQKSVIHIRVFRKVPLAVLRSK